MTKLTVATVSDDFQVANDGAEDGGWAVSAGARTALEGLLATPAPTRGRNELRLAARTPADSFLA